MATVHTFLRSGLGDRDDPSESLIYGKSTANQIERWWRELRDRFEKYFKEQLMHLLKQGHYDSQNEIHRSIIAYIYILVLEIEMHLFVTNWNNHHIRFRKNTILLEGVPEHISSFPEKYGLERSGALRIANKYLENDFKNRCAELVEQPGDLDAKDCVNAYI